MAHDPPYQAGSRSTQGGIVKLRLTAVSDPQHGGFTAGSSPVSWGSLDELFVNLTAPYSTMHSNEPSRSLVVRETLKTSPSPLLVKRQPSGTLFEK